MDAGSPNLLKAVSEVVLLGTLIDKELEILIKFNDQYHKVQNSYIQEHGGKIFFQAVSFFNILFSQIFRMIIITINLQDLIFFFKRIQS